MPANLPRRLIDALGGPAMLVQSGRVTLANPAARALLGEFIEGQDIRLVLRQPAALELLLGHAPAASGVDLVGIGGAERSWRLTATSLGEGLLLARLDDLSAARAAEKMRVDFVANASHELRTPLATISGYAETLAEDAPLAEPLRRQFGRTIATEAARMLRLIEELMSLSRIEADRYRAPDQRIDLAEVARLASEECEALAERRGGRLVLDLSPAPILGDPGQLGQLATNLLSNALRYGCTSERCEVAVSVRAEGGRAVLAVRDRGEGIDPIHLPRLTERFYRVDEARSRDSGGTGLGLAIVKHIAERHRARLRIDSRPGEGTEVRVDFPLAG